MFRLMLAISTVSLVLSAVPSRLPSPDKLALVLGEEEFEDYLDKWLAITERTWVNASVNIASRVSRSACSIRVNGDLGQPQPVYIRRTTNNYLEPTGNTGIINLNSLEEVIISCPGTNRVIQHPNIVSSVHTASARCVGNALVSGSGWLNGNGAFGELTCSANAFYESQQTSDRCFNNNIVIRHGFTVNNVFYPLYWSCFDSTRLEVLYVRMVWFCTFCMAAPQWQPFNAGNWNSLEQNLRARIGVAGYNTIVYTGTFDITQLRDASGRFVDIYLESNNRIPVPLYFYKVVYDGARRQGTAFISINNPYYTLAEARALQFCTDRCRNNANFNWIRWQPDRVDIGYSFCCTISDFRNRVAHLPVFDVSNGLLF